MSSHSNESKGKAIIKAKQPSAKMIAKQENFAHAEQHPSAGLKLEIRLQTSEGWRRSYLKQRENEKAHEAK